MATRSSICLQKKDGNCISVYCHSDGYPEHNGKILLESYNNLEAVEKLISHGDMSQLNGNMKDCVFYHRDDQDKALSFGGALPRNFYHKEQIFIEFLYVFDEKQNTWFCHQRFPARHGKLTDFLKEKNLC